MSGSSRVATVGETTAPSRMEQFVEGGGALLQLVRSGNLDRDDRRACLRGDGGISAEDGERSPDCRIARRSSLGRGAAAAVSQIVNGALPRVSSHSSRSSGIASPAAG
jgi:hypothetical protein